ncbi:MAG: lipid A deacylase LpxR family protein [Woeseiaceae bacterium]
MLKKSALKSYRYVIAFSFILYVSSLQHVIAFDYPMGSVKEEYWSIQLENDFFARSGDRYYTNGVEISQTLIGDRVQWLEDVATSLWAFDTDGEINGVNYRVGQKIFTPDNTEATDLLVNDRPYAGYLYLSAAMLSSVSRENNIHTGNLIEVTLGIVGPSAQGENVQSGFHDLIGIDKANGWDNQLHDELALGISYTRFWKEVKPLASLSYGMTPHISLTIGNVYTYAASGIMFRFGTHLNNDLAPPNIRPGFPGLSLFRPTQQSSWYLFAGIEGRAVARNIFLDGNTFSDSHSVDKKPLVADFQYGFVFQTGGMRFSISNMIRTKEFEGQKDETKFGAVNISFAM